MAGADVDAAGRVVHEDDARLDAEPLGEQHLLLVAAAEQPVEAVGVGRPTSSRSIHSITASRSRRCGTRPPLANSGSRPSVMFSPIVKLGIAAAGWRLGRTRARPSRSASLGSISPAHVLAVQRQLHLGLDAPQTAAASTSRPEPESPATPSTSPGMDLEVDPGQRVAAQAAHDSTGSAVGAASTACSGDLDLLADDQLGEPAAVHGRGREGPLVRAVAQDRDLRRQVEDLVEAVGDVEDAHALGDDFAQHREERLALRRRQRRRGLVEDQQRDLAAAVVEGAGDREGAALDRAQLGDRRSTSNSTPIRPSSSRVSRRCWAQAIRPGPESR